MDITKRKSKKLIICIVSIIVVIIITGLIFSKDSIKLNSLLKKDNIIIANGIEKIENEIYPGSNKRYINITSDGILYVFEDNGYNKDDRHIKYTLLKEYELDVNKLELLKFELNNIMTVSPKDKENDSENTKYFEITLNGSTKTIYQKDFYNLLQRYDIDIEGEDDESL